MISLYVIEIEIQQTLRASQLLLFVQAQWKVMLNLYFWESFEMEHMRMHSNL